MIDELSKFLNYLSDHYMSFVIVGALGIVVFTTLFLLGLRGLVVWIFGLKEIRRDIQALVVELKAIRQEIRLQDSFKVLTPKEDAPLKRSEPKAPAPNHFPLQH